MTALNVQIGLVLAKQLEPRRHCQRSKAHENERNRSLSAYDTPHLMQSDGNALRGSLKYSHGIPIKS